MKTTITMFMTVILLTIGSKSVQAQYCIPTVDTVYSGGSGMRMVVIPGTPMINRTSSSSEGYINTNMVTAVSQGQNMSVQVEGIVGTFCSKLNLSIYVDWNQDEDWDDVGEEMVFKTGLSGGMITSYFNVPTDAKIGQTRMRILEKMEESCGHNPIEPCGYDPFVYHGEIEDYTLDILPSAPTADFAATKLFIKTGEKISFKNNSLSASSYEWTFEGADTTSSTDAEPEDISYSAPGKYDVQLIAINGSLKDTILKQDFIDVSQSLSISRNRQLNKFNIHPNPAVGKFKIKGAAVGIGAQLNIYNILGDVVWSEEIRSSSIKEIDMQNFEEGVYIISLSRGKEVFTDKLIIHR